VTKYNANNSRVNHTATAQDKAYSKDFLIIHTPMVSTGARAYNRGLGAEPPAEVKGAAEADEVFAFKTLIFNASATVLHQMM